MTTGESGLSKIIDFLKENPKYRETLRLALDHEERNKDNKDYKGWEWHDVRINPPELPKLVNERLIDIKYKSKRYTNYLLHDKESIRRALNELEKEERDRIFKVSEKKGGQ